MLARDFIGLDVNSKEIKEEFLKALADGGFIPGCIDRQNIFLL
jgi:hypothetical protein